VQCSYLYDFGDGWMHQVSVEQVLPRKRQTTYPRCIAGRRACPPEDVGGIAGYQDFLDALADPRHPGHEDALEWVGGEFDPESLDLAAVNERLQVVGQRSWTGAPVGADSGAVEEAPALFDAERCQGLFTADDKAHAETLALRRDAVTMLTYLQGNRVRGTASTGNFPLKAVAEMAARFVDPPKMERTVLLRTYPIRTETELWPVYFLHVLLAIARLVDGGLNKRWRVTPAGEDFLSAPSLDQVVALFATWWLRMNWEIACFYSVASEHVIEDLPDVAWEQLMAIPPGRTVPFEPFADELIDATGWLRWDEDDQDTRYLIYAALEGILIERLVDFGAAVATYDRDEGFGLVMDSVATFELTPFGRRLLEAVS
jgi:hypothetical protein